MVEPKYRSRSSSDGSKSPSSSSSWEAHSKSQKRQWVISELEQIFAQYGNPLPKDSVAVERRLFEASRTQVEYSALARRLIYTTAEMARNMQIDAAKQEKGSRAGHWKMDQKKRYLEEEEAANSLLAMANQEEEPCSSSALYNHPGKVLNEPSPFLRRPAVIVANVPAPPQEEARRRIDFGLIHLPHLKRPIETAAPLDVAAKRRKSSLAAPQDALQVVMVDDDERDTESEDGRRTELSVNQTYEATITVFIPMGYSIGRINVALRKNAENEE